MSDNIEHTNDELEEAITILALLAEFLNMCLTAYGRTVNARDKLAKK